MSDIGVFSSPTFKVETRDGHNFTLLEPAWFDRPFEQGRIFLPAGTQSDGASTPAALWSFGFAPFGSWWRAAFVHDFTYKYTQMPKDACDLTFFEAMIADGVPKKKANEFYEGVVFGGHHAFDEDRRALAASQDATDSGRRRDVAG